MDLCLLLPNMHAPVLTDIADELEPQRASAWLQAQQACSQGSGDGRGPHDRQAGPRDNSAAQMSGADPALAHLLGGSRGDGGGGGGDAPDPVLNPTNDPSREACVNTELGPGLAEGEAGAVVGAGAAIDEALNRCAADLGVSTDQVRCLVAGSNDVEGEQ